MKQNATILVIFHCFGRRFGNQSGRSDHFMPNAKRSKILQIVNLGGRVCPFLFSNTYSDLKNFLKPNIIFRSENLKIPIFLVPLVFLIFSDRKKRFQVRSLWVLPEQSIFLSENNFPKRSMFGLFDIFG